MEEACPLLLRVIRHPVFGLIGWCCTLIAVFAAAYFYREATREPELTYSVRPLRTIIVRKGHSPDLRVFYDGKEITSPVTGVEVVIWNQGDQVIRTSHLPEPIILQTDGRAPILEMQTKPSRSSIGLRVRTDRLSEGRAMLTWSALFPGDALLVRIIYRGEPDARIFVVGTIEGQGRIRRFDSPEGTIYRRPFKPGLRRIAEIYVAGIVFVGFVAIVLGYVMSRWMPAWLRWGLVLPALLVFLGLICFVVYGMWGTYETPPEMFYR